MPVTEAEIIRAVVAFSFGCAGALVVHRLKTGRWWL